MCPFASLHPLRNEKENKFISKKGNKKKIMHLVPKVVIDLPFEGRKVEGSQKYRTRIVNNIINEAKHSGIHEATV